MAKPLWNDRLAIGVAEIDDQHRELFSRFEQLLEACHQGKGREELKRLLDFLAEYVNEHFAAEEEYMASKGYPGIKEHQQEHALFKAKLNDLRQLYIDSGAGMDLLITTNATVLDWIIQHVSKVDRKLADLG